MVETTTTVGHDDVFDALDCGVALLDAAGRVALWNAWLARRSGIAAEAARGKTLEALFGEAAAPALLEAVVQACSYGLASVLSNQLHRHVLPLRSQADGALVEQSASVRPVRGTGLGCLLQVNDVSAAVRRERHLRQSQAAVRLRNRAMEASSQGIMITDARIDDMPIIYANPAFTRITGFTSEEVMGRNGRFLHRGDRDQAGLETIRRAIAERRECMAVLRNYRKDGSAFWNELMIAPVFDATGDLTHFVGIQRDITARRNAEQSRDVALSDLRLVNERLSREKAFTGAVLRTVGALVAVVDRRGRIVSFNRACEMATGLSESEAVGTRLGELIPDPAEAAHFRLDEQGGTRAKVGLTTALRTVSGDQRIVRWTFSSLCGTEDMVSHLICTGIDVTERDRATALLRAEREILEMVARAEPLPSIGARLCLAIEEQLPGRWASLLLLDPDARALTYCAGPSLPEAFQRGLANVVVGQGGGVCGTAAFTGQPAMTADIGADPKCAAYHALAVEAGVHSCWSVPVLSSTDGGLGTFAIYGRESRLPDDLSMEIMQRAARMAAIAIERHQAAERIRFLALYDQLTGLANRSLLSDRLQSALASARRHRHQVALLFLDLDGFKPVNDRYGHDAGDAVLAAVARRLKGVLRESDTAARIGGDEFVILAEEVGGRLDAERIARKILVALATPMVWEGTPVTVGTSIGLALFPDDAQSSDGLLTVADDAMYMAKAAGKNRWAWRDGGL